MRTKRANLVIEEKGEARALMVSGSDFLRSSFEKRLVSQGVKVVFWEDFSKAGEASLEFDYLIYIFKRGELREFLQKPVRVRGRKFLFLAPVDSSSKLSQQDFADFAAREEIDARLVFFAHLYGPGMDFSEESAFSAFLKLALAGKLRIFGEGLEKCYPTFIDDFIEGGLRALFYQGTTGKIFYLINSRSLTIINLAYLFKKILPDESRLEFISQKTKEQLFIDESSLLVGARFLNWEPKVTLEEGLVAMMKGIRKGEKRKEQRRRKGRKKKALRIRGQGLRRWLTPRKSSLAAICLILVVVLFPFLRGGGHLFLGVRALEKGKEFFKADNLDQAEREILEAKHHFLLVKDQLRRVGRVPFLPFREYFYQTEKGVEAGIDFCQATEHLFLAADYLQEAFEFIFTEEKTEESLSELLEKSSQELKLVYEKLSLVEGSLQTLSSSKGKIQHWLGAGEQFFGEDKLSGWRQKIALFYPLLPDLEKILGSEEKKTYLILFQNNMELRPTGGFIGSYGLMTFDKGKFLDLKVEDVYTADGQLKGHVEPPRPIRIYLNEAGWYLRDSNWSPDFFESALSSAWFLEKEMGVKVDGVVGVNLLAAKKFLEALGPIWLVDFEEEITAENLFAKAEYQAEKDFFPGSTQKKDFLGSLSRQLFEEVKTAEAGERIEIGKAIWQSLEERQILISLNDKEVMSLINNYGWDGALRNLSCQLILGAGNSEVDCLADYTFFVEANLGVNKANYFLKRRVVEEARIKEQGVERVLDLFYENESPGDSWPGGDYKNYLRVIVPGEAQVLAVKIGDLLVEEEKIDQEERGDKRSFGLLVNVPAGEKRRVTFKYFLPFKAKKQKLIYLFLIQKQSGIEADPLEVLIRTPSFWQVRSISPPGLTGKEMIVYNTDLSKDRLFKVEMEVKR